MDVAKLVTELETLGIDLWTDSGRLRFRAPKGLLTEDRMALLRAHKARIVDLLSADQAVTVVPEPQARHEPFPLTDVQTAYLLGRHESFGYGRVACHGYLEVTYPDLDPARLEDAWNALIARHDMLRGVIERDGSQHILPDVPRYRITVADLRGTPRDAVDEALNAVRADLDHRIHDTPTWPLFEVRQTRTDTGDVVHFSLDALIADWASAGILFSELDAILASRAHALPALDITFRDYLLAERRLRDTSRYRADHRYWLARVDELPPAPELPRSMVSTDDGPVRFRRHHARLPMDQWQRLCDRARRRGLTASTLVLAAYAAVVRRWSRRPRFSLNMTLLNRHPLHPQVNHLVGDFTSVSLLAVDWTDEQPFRDQAARIGEQLLADLDHRLFSGIEVIREIARRRGREAALMPVVFTSAIGLGSTEAPASGRRAGRGITQTPQVVLDCQVMDDADGLEVNWDVRQGVFPDGVVEDMFAAMDGLLGALADGDQVWDVAGPVSLPAWQSRERADANQTACPLPDALLHQAPLRAAARTPDAPAVIAPTETLTHGDLARRAAGVAAVLDAEGITTGEPVAVVMTKGVEQVVAVLGIVMAGGAYLPFDAHQPALRRDKVLGGAGVRIVLTQSRLAGDMTVPEGARLVAVDTVAPSPTMPADAPRVAPDDLVPDDLAPDDLAPDDLAPDDLAYVIYTSGSTGEPKGVMISHRAALNTIEDINRRFGVTGGDRMLGLARLGFDLSVYDIFGVLGLGGALVLPDPDRSTDPSHWAALIAEHGVTLWNSVPAQMQMLVNYLDTEAMAVPSLRLALLSGDWIPVSLPDQVRRHVPGISLVGLGGATEASIWSNYHRIGVVDPAWTSIPYGLPLANQGFRVLDDALRDVPVWVTGDLYITGHGLAMGYLNDPALTAARFIHHPVDGQRLYRTGDLGRYLPGGEIEFLGREDGQVKIRGHRVEIGEVEAALSAHPAVAAAAVAVAGTDRADRLLLGFVETARRASAPGGDKGLDLDAVGPAIRRAGRDRIGDLDPARVTEGVKALRDAVLVTMMGAFRDHGLFRTSGETHSAEDVLDAARVDARHRWLVRRWLDLLVEAGWLDEDPETRRYASGQPADGGSVEEAWRRVDRVGADGLWTSAFVDYHRAHAATLPALLAGEGNPVELLFPEGRHTFANAVYRDDAISRHNNAVVAALVERIAASYAGDGPIRVIELGAGTGATTESIVPVLDGRDVDYLFTDMTAFFLADARNRFRPFPWVRFGLFDLNGDPRAQGIAPNTADIVLCAGMLSSTADVAASVTKVVDLLAPGGWLILTEPVAGLPHILVTQGFMMEPAGGDRDRDRGQVKFRSLEQWRTLIQARGGEVALCLPDDDDPLTAFGVGVVAARFKTDRRRVTAEALSAFLSRRLPAHMVPTHLGILDQLPLTANGKVDRKTLADWWPSVMRDGGTAAAEGEADDLEARLRALWAEALGVPRLGGDDNVYDLGADSLIMARVAGRLREEVPEAATHSYDALLRQMLNEPTVGALTRMIRAAEGPAAAERPGSGSSSGPGMAFRAGKNGLLVPFGGGEGVARVMFHAALGTLDYLQHLGKTLAAQSLGPVLGVAVADTETYVSIDHKDLVERCADDYAQALIDAGHERFQLIGYCLGGLLAVEVGRRLLDRGMDVRSLMLVDSMPMFVDTDEELAFEAIFVPNLNLDPVTAVFGDEVEGADVYRAIETLMVRNDRRIPSGALARLTGDPGLEAVAAAARKRLAVPQEERLLAYARSISAESGVPVAPEMIPGFFRVCRHSMRAALFEPAAYVGDVTYLRCMEEQDFGITGGVGHMAVPFWENVCIGGFKVVDVPGNHFSVVEPPHVGVVTEHLGAALKGDA